eukprot:9487851-Pyramimonas_sp.AAC.1
MGLATFLKSRRSPHADRLDQGRINIWDVYNIFEIQWGTCVHSLRGKSSNCNTGIKNPPAPLWGHQVVGLGQAAPCTNTSF